MKKVSRQDLENLEVEVDFNQPYELETEYGTLYLYRVYKNKHTIRCKERVELKPYLNVKPHKYGKTCVYVVYCVQECNKSYNKYYNDYKKYHDIPSHLTAQRLYYAAKYGEVDNLHDVDHIDDNKFNNRIENLQLLTRKENLGKRFLMDSDKWSSICKEVWKKRKEENNVV